MAEKNEMETRGKEILLERKKENQLSIRNPRIYSLSMRKSTVYKLQTALGFVSTIDLPEPALKVFIGDQELFKVGVYENQVLIKPITDESGARTNLTVVTESGRLTFDVSVGPSETADFVLEFRQGEEDALVDNAFKKAVEETQAGLKKEYEEKLNHLDHKARELAEAKLKEAVAEEFKTIGLKEEMEVGGVKLKLFSLSRLGSKQYLRFGIRNLSNAPYVPLKAAVGIGTYKKRWFGLRKSQEGFEEFPSELQLQKSVLQHSYAQGVIVFEGRALKEKETPVFFLFEVGAQRNFKVKGFKWIS